MTMNVPLGIDINGLDDVDKEQIAAIGRGNECIQK